MKHTCRVAGCEAESLVSKYMYICFDCLVRIFVGQPHTWAIGES